MTPVQCHGGPMLSDYKLHFIGVVDPGPDARRELRTPTLRQLRDTAPYMHNGVFKTLEAVIDFYNNGGGYGLKIAPPAARISQLRRDEFQNVTRPRLEPTRIFTLLPARARPV